MTIQCFNFLSVLKKAQPMESSFVCVDFENHTVSPLENETQTIDISKYKESVVSILEHLEKKEYIKFANSKGYWQIKVTHKGYHLWQIAFFKMFKFTLVSIIVPIVVSAITTLITICLSR